MKKLLFILLLAPILALAQKDTAITYSEVVTVDSVTKDQLFQRARSWFNDAFKSSKDVLQIQDKESGELAGKGVSKDFIKISTSTQFYYISFQVNIRVKDGRYKYESTNSEQDYDNTYLVDLGLITSSITNPNKPQGLVSKRKNDEMWNAVKDKLKIKCEEIIASLKVAMAKQLRDF